VEGLGVGTGEGGVFTGGASNGNGLEATGGATNGNGGVFTGTGTGSAIVLNKEVLFDAEISDPGAPSANAAKLYIKDNGSGKTQLAVRFNTGAVQIIATEP
jgi:hypothetical protein